MDWLPLQVFSGVLVFFHLSEFMLAYVYMRQEFSSTSFLISRPYCVAMTCAILEYFVEAAMFPVLTRKAMLCVGLVMVLAGELLRKSAMVTARHSFTHTLHLTEHPTNELVKSGPYRFARHPGYLGWMLWAIGTQVMLCNPVCILGFTLMSWCFFKRRIEIEECQLKQFFGERYVVYAKCVPTRIPGIP